MSSLFMTERRWASHHAFLDIEIGSGVLVLPRPEEDVADPFADGLTPGSLHDAELETVLDDLHQLSPSFTPSLPEDDLDEWCVEGWTADGRMVVALVALDGLVTTPDVEQEAQAMRGLREAAGVVSPA